MKQTSHLTRTAAAISLMILASVSVLSCGNTDNGPDNEITQSTLAQSTDSETQEVKEESDYAYDGCDLNGRNILFLNVEKDLWNNLCVIQPDTLTGETVNDALFERNAYVCNKLNCTISEYNVQYDTVSTTLNKSVLANDDVYQAAYVPMSFTLSGMTSGYYLCLSDIDTLQLEKGYWDQKFLAATTILGKNYYAQSPLQLMAYDTMWVLFFNKEIMNSLDLEYPYQLVRDGKWTYDTMTEYCKAAANLNGDQSFHMTPDGNATYGFVSYHGAIDKFLYAGGADFVIPDGENFKIVCDQQRFIDAFQKLQTMFCNDGSFLIANAAETAEDNYMIFYRNNRSLFLGSELSHGQELRSIESEYGIVPLPKYSEDQKEYRTTQLSHACVAIIPTTANKPEEIGLVMDALSYESERQVVGLYFGEYVEQKGLRDEESIDMLHIIRSSSSFDTGVGFGWAYSFVENMWQSASNDGPFKNYNIVSQSTKLIPLMQKNIDKTLNAIVEHES